ncbi:MAG: cofactor-independent phosphoglycerate mutase [Anaerovoracaceae bacterium]
MKYLIVVPDGSADNPVESLGGKTPLEAADLPCINGLAAKGEIGSVRTVPEGISPGSDSANLSVMGYDPRKYLTGRSPLEAASIGLKMSDSDISFRANLITIDPDGADRYEDFIVRDHAAGDITTEEAAELVDVLNEHFAEDGLYIHLGTGYRQCMIVDKSHPNGHIDYKCVPPHDILDRRAGDYLPEGRNAEHFVEMMRESYDILKDHPVNKARIARGLNPANSLWIWGQGTRPELPDFNEKYGVRGAVISAVDLIKGIAMFAGLEVLKVEGINGTKHTNFSGKAQAAIEAYEKGKDFIYMHIEGTDECSHQGDLEGKIRCAEDIDSKVVRPIYEYLKESGEDFRILVVPDHRTPLSIRTHSSDPVPFMIYDSRHETEADFTKQFNEKAAMSSGNHFEEGYTLADHFFEK